MLLKMVKNLEIVKTLLRVHLQANNFLAQVKLVTLIKLEGPWECEEV